MKRRLPTLLLTGLLSLGAIHAVAQSHDDADHWGGMGHHPSAEQWGKMHAKHVAELKQKLQITAAQEGAWNTFTEAVKPTPAMFQRPDHQALEALTTPERIDKMRALRKEHEAQIDQRDEAVKTFYAVLTPAQQKVFDAEFHRHHHGHDWFKKNDTKAQ